VVDGCDGEADGSRVKVGMEVLGGGVWSSPSCACDDSTAGWGR